MLNSFEITFSTRVNIFQRVIHAIGIAVETLLAGGVLHVVVGRKKRGELGVVHVNQAEVVEVFVAGEARTKRIMYGNMH